MLLSSEDHQLQDEEPVEIFEVGVLGELRLRQVGVARLLEVGSLLVRLDLMRLPLTMLTVRMLRTLSICTGAVINPLSPRSLSVVVHLQYVTY